MNITQVVGHTGNLGQANYAASKAGIIAFSKSLAIEYAKKNININCVSPGFIKTEMTDQINDEFRKILISKIPSGDLGKKGIKVDLEAGDMLVYRGCELEHWREKFKGKQSVQVFLHYNNTKTRFAKDNIFDRRKHLGLPNWFKR